MTKIAVLGLGAMGARMARRLVDAGHSVVVYNRSRQRADELVAAGATWGETPRAAADGADLVMSMVTDDDAARAIWLHPETGAVGALRAGMIAIESSTVTPAWVAELGRAVSATGAALIDAPVAGSRPQAEAGQLIYLVGGEAATVDSVRPVLGVMGSAVHHIGALGAGTVIKLVVNAFFGVQVAALSELLGMAAKSGIAVDRAVETLSQMPITSPALKGIGGLIAAGTFAPMFPIDLVEKDFGYAVAAAAAVGAEVPATDATRAIYARAQQAG
ncbi:MAG: NAD(P)-dependent oxidoreductase, partial [Myxococcota bacterium]